MPQSHHLVFRVFVQLSIIVFYDPVCIWIDLIIVRSSIELLFFSSLFVSILFLSWLSVFDLFIIVTLNWLFFVVYPTHWKWFVHPTSSVCKFACSIAPELCTEYFTGMWWDWIEAATQRIRYDTNSLSVIHSSVIYNRITNRIWYLLCLSICSGSSNWFLFHVVDAWECISNTEPLVSFRSAVSFRHHSFSSFINVHSCLSNWDNQTTKRISWS